MPSTLSTILGAPTKSAKHKKSLKVVPTARDDLIFELLEIIPMTAAQVKKFSETFPEDETEGPFRKKETALRRLQTLARGGYLHNRKYDKDGSFAAENYFQLTRNAWERLYKSEEEGEESEDDVPPYPKRQSEPVPPNRQHHTRSRADALIHLAWSAHRRGFRMEIVAGESEVVLSNGNGTTSLDGEVEFVRIDDERIRFSRLLEVECSRHTMRSRKYNKKTWQRRAQVVDLHADHRIKKCNERTRLLTFATRSMKKVESIAELFQQETVNPDRQVYLGTYLQEFLSEPDGLFAPVFVNHKKQRVAALPEWALQPVST